ncbi:unnamed protein product [Lactuca virosa]|uniref:Uncharacterized protein n=1 Tax=Lactuca virosa TaxID=75947 RepID=A0AAU9LML7_9ASTR|nr:unnamed protein product [Lactuca virosa]
MLMAEYCPRGEVQKMEQELWNFTVRNSDIDAYITSAKRLAKKLYDHNTKKGKKSGETENKKESDNRKGKNNKRKGRQGSESSKKQQTVTVNAATTQVPSTPHAPASSTPSAPKQYSGNLPKCNKCNLYHNGECREMQCTSCNERVTRQNTAGPILPRISSRETTTTTTATTTTTTTTTTPTTTATTLGLATPVMDVEGLGISVETAPMSTTKGMEEQGEC